MNKIKIHRYENEMWGRSHLPFFKMFDIYLSKFFDVEVINYNNDGETFKGVINLIGTYNQFGNNPTISDVDYIIENQNSGEIKVLSFTEYFNHFISHLTKSEFSSKVLLAHFSWNNIYHWMKREDGLNSLYKIKPWIFLPYKEFDINYYRDKRSKIDVLNDKIFWQGSGVDGYRKMIRIIEKEGYLQEIKPLEHDTYLENLINSKIGLSYYLDLDKYTTPFDFPGEFCYRDIEYILLGLPYIRIEYKDSLHDNLLPNVHYISIPREKAYVEYEKNGDKGVAKLYIDKFLEVKDDEVFLNYITKNQYDWADNNIIGEKIYELTFKLLELENWT